MKFCIQKKGSATGEGPIGKKLIWNLKRDVGIEKNRLSSRPLNQIYAKKAIDTVNKRKPMRFKFLTD